MNIELPNVSIYYNMFKNNNGLPQITLQIQPSIHPFWCILNVLIIFVRKVSGWVDFLTMALSQRSCNHGHRLWWLAEPGKTSFVLEATKNKMRWLDSITDSVDMNLSTLQKVVKDRGAWWATVHGVAESWTGVSDWTTTKTKGSVGF